MLFLRFYSVPCNIPVSGSLFGQLGSVELSCFDYLFMEAYLVFSLSYFPSLNYSSEVFQKMSNCLFHQGWLLTTVMSVFSVRIERNIICSYASLLVRRGKACTECLGFFIYKFGIIAVVKGLTAVFLRINEILFVKALKKIR